MTIVLSYRPLTLKRIAVFLLYAVAGMVFIGTSRLHAQEGTVSVERFRDAVHVLGSDSLKGRGTGTPGAAMAARYIAAKLRAAGIEPAGDRTTYLQSIPMHGSFPLDDCALTIRTGNEDHELALWDDYVLYKTGAGTFIPSPLPLVFVGYGIVAPEYDYNDYASVDVNDAIVIMLEGEPLSYDEEYFNGDIPTYHSYPERKQQIAFSRGARGSIIIPLPRLHYNPESWDDIVHDFSFEHVTLLYGLPENLAARVHPRVTDLLFADAEYSYTDVLEMDTTSSVRSFPLVSTASFHGHFLQRDFVGHNVAGMLKGTDPALADSYLLLSAHYDHLGVGPIIRGDSIYNGVGDNAMGVSALLEVARLLKQQPPKRSVLFLFVTGEEKGLLGSRYYCDNPIVPLHKTIANLNIDGIAMFDRFKEVIGIGTELSSIRTHLAAAAAQSGLTVSDLPPLFRAHDIFERSDQIAFAAAGIPSILVMDGLKSETLSEDQIVSLFASWGQNVYHTPFDDLTQAINYEASAQHIGLLLRFASILANTDSPPEWNEGTYYRTVRLQTIAEER